MGTVTIKTLQAAISLKIPVNFSFFAFKSSFFSTSFVLSLPLRKLVIRFLFISNPMTSQNFPNSQPKANLHAKADYGYFRFLKKIFDYSFRHQSTHDTNQQKTQHHHKIFFGLYPVKLCKSPESAQVAGTSPICIGI